MFTPSMITELEWQQIVPMQTPKGHYRVEITWALDRYRVSVWRRVQEPEKFTEFHHPKFARTAIETANRMLRKYARRER